MISPHGTEHPPRYCTHIIQGGYVTLSYIFAAQVFPRYIKDLKIPAITVPACFPSSGSPESVYFDIVRKTQIFMQCLLYLLGFLIIRVKFCSLVTERDEMISK